MLDGKIIVIMIATTVTVTGKMGACKSFRYQALGLTPMYTLSHILL